MVKGVTRQVIIVKSPDPRLFEQAIFIVRENATGVHGVTSDQILQEARQAAACYIRRNTQTGRSRLQIPGAAFMAAGAGLTGLLWLVVTLI